MNNGCILRVHIRPSPKAYALRSCRHLSTWQSRDGLVANTWPTRNLQVSKRDNVQWKRAHSWTRGRHVPSHVTDTWPVLELSMCPPFNWSSHKQQFACSCQQHMRELKYRKHKIQQCRWPAQRLHCESISNVDVPWPQCVAIKISQKLMLISLFLPTKRQINTARKFKETLHTLEIFYSKHKRALCQQNATPMTPIFRYVTRSTSTDSNINGS